MVSCLFAAVAAIPHLCSASEFAQQLDALFNRHIYDPKPFGPARWLDDGKEYTTVEPSAIIKGAQEIVKYDTATGTRSVLVSAARLVPAAGGSPLAIDDYFWSSDKKQLLLFTNAKKVWRARTRGDYWTYDLASGRMQKLGGTAAPSSLMFATFSPDGRSVAYVRANNIYVQDLASSRIRQLTSDGSADIINGTTDWVTEEEFGLRDAFRWSPDSHSIAYWQFDQSGVGEFTLINDTAEEYPQLTRYKYPQPGTTNSAVRVGVVSVAGGETRWVKLAGEPRNHYIARMD